MLPYWRWSYIGLSFYLFSCPLLHAPQCEADSVDSLCDLLPYLTYLLSSPYHSLNSQVVYLVNLSSHAYNTRITELSLLSCYCTDDCTCSTDSLISATLVSLTSCSTWCLVVTAPRGCVADKPSSSCLFQWLGQPWESSTGSRHKSKWLRSRLNFHNSEVEG